MVTFGYFCSMEEFSPGQCLDQAVWAEDAGFDTIWVNDHFHPWFDRLADGTEAHGGNCWAWMPAALERTDGVEIGTGVSAILNRYHPAAVAQRLGTMMELYPDRVFLGLGTGEAFNEVPLGLEWPAYSERAQRTAEAIRIVRRLFREDHVDHEGRFWNLEAAHLYSAPSTPPAIYVAASGPTSARMAGDLGDGFVTANADPDAVTSVLFPAVETGVERSDRNDSVDDVERILHLHCAYGETVAEALEPCAPWRTTLLPEMRNLADPRYIQAHGDKVDPDQLRDAFVVFTDPADLVEATQTYVDRGFDQIVYQPSGPDQRAFCEMARDEVFPSFD